MICLISTPSLSLFTGFLAGAGDSGRESAQRKGDLLTSMQRNTETKTRLRRVRRKE